MIRLARWRGPVARSSERLRRDDGKIKIEGAHDRARMLRMETAGVGQRERVDRTSGGNRRSGLCLMGERASHDRAGYVAARRGPAIRSELN